MFILVVFLFVALHGAQNPFNGHWQLEMGREAGASDALLQLLGVSAMQRSVILSLNVVEQYEVGAKTLRLVRDTWYSHSDDTFTLGETQQVDDLLLGHVKQTVTAQATRIVTAVVRADGSQYSSVRKMEPSNARFSATMNYTTVDGRQAGCIRHYTKVHSAMLIGDRVGRLEVVRTPGFTSQVRPALVTAGQQEKRQ